MHVSSVAKCNYKTSSFLFLPFQFNIEIKQDFFFKNFGQLNNIRPQIIAKYYEHKQFRATVLRNLWILFRQSINTLLHK